MPRGGKRTGTPGKSYSNRSDLAVPMSAASGQAYGAKAEQMAAQRAIPIARPATDAVPQGGPPSAAPAGPPGPPMPQPGQVTSLGAPSMRPDEPVTAGMPMGAGPGLEALGPLASGGEDVNMQLRAIYRQFPNEDLRRVLEAIDTDDGSGFS